MGISTMMKGLIVASCLLAVALAFPAGLDSQQLGDALTGSLQMTSVSGGGCASGMATAGDKLTMQYTGIIDPNSATGTKGQKFDSSLDHGTPFSFTLGQGEVIQGWDQGLVGICPGEKRKLVVPPAMAYGDQGAGSAIPGGATLDFDVECVKVN